ncbi:MAG TPA: hypothetical protein VFR55_13985 [Dehalococcoidia bacterium]|nr:hypothetical protein [Dehalococcoidia bacterium]
MWAGILVNAVFWVPALFSPQVINNAFGFDPNYSPVWLRNVGMLLLLVAIFNGAAAINPERHQIFAWLVVVARLIAASFFLEIWLLDHYTSSDQPDVFKWFFITDANFGIAKGICLYLGFRQLRNGH